MSSKRKRRKPEQVIRCLAEGESMLAAGKPAAEVYQKFGIAESTWMRWKQRYGGMKSDDHTPAPPRRLDGQFQTNLPTLETRRAQSIHEKAEEATPWHG